MAAERSASPQVSAARVAEHRKRNELLRNAANGGAGEATAEGKKRSPKSKIINSNKKQPVGRSRGS